MKRSFQTWLFICFIFAIVFGSLNAIAQLSVKGIPESFNLSLKNAHNIPVFQLDSVQINKLLQEDRKYKIDNRYGIIQQCNINIKDLAVKTEITGKGTIWQYKIESKNAFSLGLFFKTFNLPEGASVFIYDSSK